MNIYSKHMNEVIEYGASIVTTGALQKHFRTKRITKDMREDFAYQFIINFGEYVELIRLKEGYLVRKTEQI